jgi:hypothetical protein
VRALKRAAKGHVSADDRENAAYGAQKEGVSPDNTFVGPNGERPGLSHPGERSSRREPRAGNLKRQNSREPLRDGGDADDDAADADLVSRPLDDDATMEEVRRYRESFAALLVAGGRLRGLEGYARYMLERRKMKEEMAGEEMDHEGKPHDGKGEDNTL